MKSEILFFKVSISNMLYDFFFFQERNWNVQHLIDLPSTIFFHNNSIDYCSKLYINQNILTH